ncbi:MAG: S-methyl-5-thioribose-1-phosphate isomerase, partial [Spirochaetaceae bacterium]|nr:S-methyl-5-thioribose-1-phosphate isomerase [Spirochaetaceae bacterium]
MNVNGHHYRTIWTPDDGEPGLVRVIDQRVLPHRFEVMELRSVDDYRAAIFDMAVRGAGLIGATAAYGMWAAAVAAPDNRTAFNEAIEQAAGMLMATRPTAKNLEWAVEKQRALMASAAEVAQAREAARVGAAEVADSDASMCASIGAYGLEV